MSTISSVFTTDTSSITASGTETLVSTITVPANYNKRLLIDSPIGFKVFYKFAAATNYDNAITYSGKWRYLHVLNVKTVQCIIKKNDTAFKTFDIDIDKIRGNILKYSGKATIALANDTYTYQYWKNISCMFTPTNENIQNTYKVYFNATFSVAGDNGYNLGTGYEPKLIVNCSSTTTTSTYDNKTTYINFLSSMSGYKAVSVTEYELSYPETNYFYKNYPIFGNVYTITNDNSNQFMFITPGIFSSRTNLDLELNTNDPYDNLYGNIRLNSTFTSYMIPYTYGNSNSDTTLKQLYGIYPYTKIKDYYGYGNLTDVSMLCYTIGIIGNNGLPNNNTNIANNGNFTAGYDYDNESNKPSSIYILNEGDTSRYVKTFGSSGTTLSTGYVDITDHPYREIRGILIGSGGGGSGGGCTNSNVVGTIGGGGAYVTFTISGDLLKNITKFKLSAGNGGCGGLGNLKGTFNGGVNLLLGGDGIDANATFYSSNDEELYKITAGGGNGSGGSNLGTSAIIDYALDNGYNLSTSIQAVFNPANMRVPAVGVGGTVTKGGTYAADIGYIEEKNGETFATGNVAGNGTLNTSTNANSAYNSDNSFIGTDHSKGALAETTRMISTTNDIILRTGTRLPGLGGQDFNAGVAGPGTSGLRGYARLFFITK